MLILRQICGFSVQILPCAILCIYPFYNKFKAGKNNLFLGVFAAVFVVMASIFTFLLYVRCRKHSSNIVQGFRMSFFT